eukprot:TRINITY_DN5931_c0_g1_i2.p1 TRINITY_DN5931_c0_g1~~TRINITY_DN5931_c0_g1_i2.p1  ORF type:complete len:339 (+),score=111.66 TRINITY_DN5931_c0_g1_i2:57-1073(+)
MEERVGQGRAMAAPLCRFGVIADVQYADIDDRTSFCGRYHRRYRGALDALRRAVAAWAAEGCSFVMDLGDIIDQTNEAEGTVAQAVAAVVNEFEKLQAPHYHLVGNHELYCFTRDEMKAAIPRIAAPGDAPSSGAFYHAFSPAPGWRVLVVDGYDRHVIAEREPPADLEASYQLLERHNSNDVRAPRGTVNWSAGLTGTDLRWMPFNGAVGDAQLAWLAGEVADLTARGERGVVCCHLPVHPDACDPACLAWNYEAVLSVVHGGNVAAWFSGHDHGGGYHCDDAGLHHMTLPSPLHTTDAAPTAHGVVELHADAIRVVGSGVVPSRTFALKPLKPPAD